MQLWLVMPYYNKCCYKPIHCCVLLINTYVLTNRSHKLVVICCFFSSCERVKNELKFVRITHHAASPWRRSVVCIPSFFCLGALQNKSTFLCFTAISRLSLEGFPSSCDLVSWPQQDWVASEFTGQPINTIFWKLRNYMFNALWNECRLKIGFSVNLGFVAQSFCNMYITLSSEEGPVWIES